MSLSVFILGFEFKFTTLIINYSLNVQIDYRIYSLRSFKRAKEKLNLIWSIPTPVPIAWNGIDVHGRTKSSAMKRKITRKMEDGSCDNEVRSGLFVAVSPGTIETLYGWPMPWLEGLAPLGARREAPPSLTSQSRIVRIQVT